MCDDFINKINEIYSMILQPLDLLYKLNLILEQKKYLGISKGEFFGKMYYEMLKKQKLKGVVYTPLNISEYMAEITITAEDVIKNPNIRILDPSCGCGNILIQAFFRLRSIFRDNIDAINELNNMNLTLENIDEYIVNNNLYGYDIDEFSLKILIIDLFTISENYNVNNFSKTDFLLLEEENFDIILANPPYIGHKAMDLKYKEVLKLKFTDVYKDKGDISYCFINKFINDIKDGGKISLITSRYFLEAPSGEFLREFIKNNTYVVSMVDYYGIRPFDNIGIDPIIISLEKQNRYNDMISVIKPKKNCKISNSSMKLIDLVMENDKEHLDIFKVDQAALGSKGWVLIDNIGKRIIDKINDKCVLSLQNICESYQGIITGCDGAFIVTSTTMIEEKLEIQIIKPWIKSSNIKKNGVNNGDKYIIYSNLIKCETDYPKCIEHIKPYYDRLMNRRECVSGIRNWYELQWGRKQEIFEKLKIIFPYKSSKNLFVMDKGNYFSADIYSVVIKEGEIFTYDFLTKLLNSNLYEFYFKSFAKKLGDELYEYYPNTVMKIRIPFNNFDINNEADIYNYFNINSDEIQYIKEHML